MASNRLYNKANKYGVKIVNDKGAIKSSSTLKKEIRYNKVALARQNNSLRADRKANFNTISGGIGIALAIMLTFILVRSVVDENFVFSIFGFIESIAEVPTISLQEILSWDFNLPEWLGFIQSISQVVSLLFSCLYNVVVIVIWFLKFLFIGA